MEQTLGKRIAEHRKRLGLTQDALAEKLGITAQAVSKWENDQSCPDITMLPKLAEIFGISTDELLGVEPKQIVHEAEVVCEEDPESGDEKGNWELHWDGGKRGSVTFALAILLVGLLTLCSRVLDWGASFWSILWPSLSLVYGVEGICRHFSVLKIGMALIGGVYLLNNLGFVELAIFGDWIFPLAIILFGISLLLDAQKKPNKPRFTVTHNGKRVSGSKQSSSECHINGERFECDLSFGSHTFPVDLHRLAGGEASVSFGELVMDLTGCQTVAEDCAVDADCSFGALRIRVPRRFAVISSKSTAFAAVNIIGQPDPAPQGVIHLDADASFGEISIEYI